MKKEKEVLLFLKMATISVEVGDQYFFAETTETDETKGTKDLYEKISSIMKDFCITSKVYYKIVVEDKYSRCPSSGYLDSKDELLKEIYDNIEMFFDDFPVGE